MTRFLAVLLMVISGVLAQPPPTVPGGTEVFSTTAGMPPVEANNGTGNGTTPAPVTTTGSMTMSEVVAKKGANTKTAKILTAAVSSAPNILPNNCNVTVEYNNCTSYDLMPCPPGTLYDVRKCMCNHGKFVDKVTCTSVPEFIPNNCGVKLRAGIQCRQFGGKKLRCPAGTAFDIRFCLCNHSKDVNLVTCSS